VELYDNAELVDCWHGVSCSSDVSLRYWNLIGRRFRVLSGVKTVETASADEARGQRNGRQNRITSQPFEFSLVNNEGSLDKEETTILTLSVPN
jgi:hypothetical protein